MADINAFIDTLGKDISTSFAPRIEAEVVQIGTQVADRAAPKVHDFANQLAPKVQEFANQLVKDIFAQQSIAIRDFAISLIQSLAARYEPTIAGTLHTKIVDKGLVLASNDVKLDIKERATGKLIASLDLPINLPIAFKDIFVKLDSATIEVENFQS